MKKILTITAIVILYSCSSGKKKTDIIYLPLKEVNGFGPFKESLSMLLWTSSEKAEQETEGIPESWNEYYVQQISFDAFQTAFQNYIKEGFSESKFESDYKNWTRNPNERKLSKTQINSFVNIVFRENEKGIIEYILDTNNNKDFSDEKIETPLKVYNNFSYSTALKNTSFVNYQLSTTNNILEKEVKTLILLNENNNILYSFPHYYETVFLNKKIYVSNGFCNTSFDERSSIKIIKNTQTIELNEIVTINNNTYKNLGVDLNKNSLLLQKLPKDKTTFSTNIGYQAIPFNIKNLNSKDSVSLSSFKGKFVFIDFWGTWCSPCLMELPTNIDAYEKTSRNDIEFLGISVYDKKEKLKKGIVNYGINYPQFLETDSKNLKQKYNIIGFPTTFLIDPKGKIVAKNLKGEKLLDSLNHYIKNYKE
ncbi:TlpA family protein disulfide reductase [Polaribacter sp. Asnod1-A03]|uniref:TlpA family protein disulfide reductase n=1 Tax=Polaribacter sp. Asnod1-A03 TaxID=3160581 RepID=UPI00386B2B23